MGKNPLARAAMTVLATEFLSPSHPTSSPNLTDGNPGHHCPQDYDDSDYSGHCGHSAHHDCDEYPDFVLRLLPLQKTLLYHCEEPSLTSATEGPPC